MGPDAKENKKDCEWIKISGNRRMGPTWGDKKQKHVCQATVAEPQAGIEDSILVELELTPLRKLWHGRRSRRSEERDTEVVEKVLLIRSLKNANRHNEHMVHTEKNKWDNYNIQCFGISNRVNLCENK